MGQSSRQSSRAMSRLASLSRADSPSAFFQRLGSTKRAVSLGLGRASSSCCRTGAFSTCLSRLPPLRRTKMKSRPQHRRPSGRPHRARPVTPRGGGGRRCLGWASLRTGRGGSRLGGLVGSAPCCTHVTTCVRVVPALPTPHEWHE
jgi:hypothetical protein